MNKSYDVIIIGAGVIGACIAFELSKKGHKTLSIDKLPESGYGSTSNSCAIIRTYYSALETCAIAYEGWHYWSNWSDHLGVQDDQGMIKYKQTGCLVIKTPHNHDLSKVCSTMDEIGCPYKHVPMAKITDYLPIVDTQQFEPAKPLNDPAFGLPTGPAIRGAVFFPHGGYVNDPKLAAHNAQVGAEAFGAEFLFRAEVCEIRQKNDRVCGVTLRDGAQIDAAIVINVAGPHSSKINEMAGVVGDMKIRTRPMRHETSHVPSPEGFDFEKEGLVYSDSDVSTYCRPEIGNNIVIGSEDPECDEPVWVEDPDNYNDSFSEQWTLQVMRMAQRFPGLAIPSKAQGVVALYDVTEDWIPIYDKSSLSGFYMAIGTSGNQFKNAPVAGKMMTALVEACESGHDHDADPLQFHLKNIDRTISLGVFSRNREIDQNSSFSVIG